MLRHNTLRYGTGYEGTYRFIRAMCKHALLGLRFRDEQAAKFPVPGELKTADRAWFERNDPVVEARMEKEYHATRCSRPIDRTKLRSTICKVFDGPSDAARKAALVALTWAPGLSGLLFGPQGSFLGPLLPL